MKLNINSKNGSVSVPKELLSHIARATKKDISVFLALCGAAVGGTVSFDEDLGGIAAAAGVSENEVIMSAAFWRGAGLLSESDDTAAAASDTEVKIPEPEKEKKISPKPELPMLTADDISNITKNSPERLELINTCQELVGKMFNTAECSVILGLKEYLGVDDEYIAIVTAYCVRKGKKAVKYIEKTALSLYDSDIESTAALEEYINYLETRDTMESRLRSLIGAGARAFTKKEKDCIDRWCRTFGFEFEVIEHAYGKTVGAIGKPSLPYMDKILGSYHEKGYKTLSDIESGEGSPQRELQTGSFDTDDFFRMAVRRGLDAGNSENK